MREHEVSANAVGRSGDPPSSLPPSSDPSATRGFIRDPWLFPPFPQNLLAGVLTNLLFFVVPSTSQSRLVQIRLFIQAMNVPPSYLRVGPVAIHIRSQGTNRQPASPSSDHSFAGPTLDVQGSVFLSPDNGMIIEELNGVVVSKFLMLERDTLREG